MDGVRETLCEIRSEHWIAKGRQFVKKIIAKCTTCKRYEGGTYQIPPQPSLPDFRVSDDFAFTRVGVDFAGPVYAKPIFPKAPVVRDETDTPAGNGSLSRRATYLKKLLEHFWKRWSREYLLELREHHRVKGVRRSAKANPKEGDIVCVYEEKTPRNLWRLGKVEKLFKGNDGQVRAVALRIWNKGKKTTLQRPVQKVYPVEGSRTDETTSVPVRRSERVAAIEARKQQSKRGR
ncbi:Hypothetical predicted protein [Paramuricea clavata]|uniref:Uncharacterized protein n=1 Tax=Paramuricea clavata TaxID=317549 RepID=A0A6S7I050_PARCT|nr:Hypothetical predicted protein [Paramuricea clavata]